MAVPSLRVAAAIAILDRAYGKPASHADQSFTNDLPPIVIHRAAS